MLDPGATAKLRLYNSLLQVMTIFDVAIIRWSWSFPSWTVSWPAASEAPSKSLHPHSRHGLVTPSKAMKTICCHWHGECSCESQGKEQIAVCQRLDSLSGGKEIAGCIKLANHICLTILNHNSAPSFLHQVPSSSNPCTLPVLPSPSPCFARGAWLAHHSRHLVLPFELI